MDVDEVRVGKARAFVLRVGRERLQRARRAFAKTAQIAQRVHARGQAAAQLFERHRFPGKEPPWLAVQRAGQHAGVFPQRPFVPALGRQPHHEDVAREKGHAAFEPLGEQVHHPLPAHLHVRFRLSRLAEADRHPLAKEGEAELAARQAAFPLRAPRLFADHRSGVAGKPALDEAALERLAAGALLRDAIADAREALAKFGAENL